jgi:hypothetical protein
MLHSEKTALAALQLRLSDRFQHAKLADRPDIQDDVENIGVEVTAGVRDDLRQLLVQEPTKQKRRALARMGITTHYRFSKQNDQRALASGALNDVASAIQRKSEKFPQYRHFNENDLFVHVMPDARAEVQGVLTKLAGVPYDKIYLWDGHAMVEINVHTAVVKRY